MDGGINKACLTLLAILIAAGGRPAQAQDYSSPAPPTLQRLPTDTSPWPAAMTDPPNGPPTPVPGRGYEPPLITGASAAAPTASSMPVPPARQVTYQEWSGPPAYSPTGPIIDPATCERFTESSWYTRVDYFHWNERIDGFDLVNEDGALTTVGYERRVGRERFRAEIFGGSVHYDGYAQFFDGTIEPLSSHTNYLGVRGEYELLFQPEFLPRSNFFTGIGTRFWIRDLVDDFTEAGDPVAGYQETWWTIYPYIGLERKRLTTTAVEFFWSSRIGLTGVTYQKASFADHPLWPKIGVFTRAELGWRGPRLSVSAVFETMNWGESDVVQGWLQPASVQSTIGLQAGFTF